MRTSRCVVFLLVSASFIGCGRTIRTRPVRVGDIAKPPLSAPMAPPAQENIPPEIPGVAKDGRGTSPDIEWLATWPWKPGGILGARLFYETLKSGRTAKWEATNDADGALQFKAVSAGGAADTPLVLAEGLLPSDGGDPKTQDATSADWIRRMEFGRELTGGVLLPAGYDLKEPEVDDRWGDAWEDRCEAAPAECAALQSVFQQADLLHALATSLSLGSARKKVISCVAQGTCRWSVVVKNGEHWVCFEQDLVKFIQPLVWRVQLSSNTIRAESETARSLQSAIWGHAEAFHYKPVDTDVEIEFSESEGRAPMPTSGNVQEMQPEEIHRSVLEQGDGLRRCLFARLHSDPDFQGATIRFGIGPGGKVDRAATMEPYHWGMLDSCLRIQLDALVFPGRVAEGTTVEVPFEFGGGES